MTLALNGGKPVRKKFLQFSEPDVRRADIKAAVSVMKSGWLSTGQKASEFETAFDIYKGTFGSLAVNSCTAALHLALMGLELQPGDEVITTDMTFGATVMAIMHVGAKPVLVDCHSLNHNIDHLKIREKITSKTKAILIVHFAGFPCAMDSITQLCREYNLYLIEDCAHAIEAEYHGRQVGTFGDMGCFSFYGTKNITTACGEGGMLVGSRYTPELRSVSLHGMSKGAAERYSTIGFKHYDIIKDGWKYNMPDVSAAFALSQFRRIDESWKRRKEIWQRYRYEFSDLPLMLPADTESHSKHAYHLFQFKLLGNYQHLRDQFLHAMTAEGIGVGVHYRAIHQQTFFKEKLGLDPKDYPMAEAIGNRVVSVPLTSRLSDSEVDDVIKAVQKVTKALI